MKYHKTSGDRLLKLDVLEERKEIVEIEVAVVLLLDALTGWQHVSWLGMHIWTLLTMYVPCRNLKVKDITKYGRMILKWTWMEEQYNESAEITNKMQNYNRVYYSKINWRLNMFRTAYGSSSGAPNCICRLWFIHPCGERPLSRLSGNFSISIYTDSYCDTPFGTGVLHLNFSTPCM
jgi:hypothetical protein